MKRVTLVIAMISLLLVACSQSNLEKEPLTLLDQNSNEVTFPQDKPTIFFFITTYT
ncbi:hypothetical protein ACFYKX_04705 [Cytobacillus sp. FJAT-54145]|uniref:Uncharacterized protein n=1 Tax=Cytobacillus spartinae TaxID=3299023 RepID=A0ABW6K9H2_9BACI